MFDLVHIVRDNIIRGQSVLPMGNEVSPFVIQVDFVHDPDTDAPNGAENHNEGACNDKEHIEALLILSLSACLVVEHSWQNEAEGSAGKRTSH